MAVYTFVNGARKRVFSNKPSVVINGTKHTIDKCYTFINGTRKQIFDTWSFKNEELFLTDGSITLPFGTYEFVLRGGGGAGGETGQAEGSGLGGVGGAGSKGELINSSVQLDGVTAIDYVVGIGGKIHASGGNGGFGGYGGSDKTTQKGGAGGGGGYPTYIKKTGVVISSALGGGGGGGGGGGAQIPNSRFRYGAGGGAGGGFYKTSNVSEKLTNSAISFYTNGTSLSTTGSEEQSLRINIPSGESLYVGQVFYGIFLSEQATVTVNSISGNNVVFGGTIKFLGSTINLNPVTINNLLTQYTGFHAVSVSGKNGADRGNYSADGYDGVAGNTTDFPNITSGHGGTGGDWGGERRVGGNSASGGGASGGGGGSNGKNADGSFGGPGGGGAGGSEDAGGGACGIGRPGNAVGATDGSNHHTIPTDTLSENSQYGVSADWGIGGSTNENGSQGFVLIKRVA